MANHIDLEFADGEYRFALGLEQIGEIQEKCGAGIGEIFARIMSGVARDAEGNIHLDIRNARFRSEDVYQAIRLGLIGGGRGVVDEQEIKVDAALARKLMTRYIYSQPMALAWDHAVAILGAVLIGYEPPKENAPGEDPPAGESAESKTKDPSI